MQQGRLGVDPRCGAIVLLVFWRVGLGIGEIWNFELFGVREKRRWSCNGVGISFQDLLHFLQLYDVPREVRRVGQDHGQVFSQIDII